MLKIDFYKKGKYTMNDVGTSNLFIDCFSDELVYCADAGDWYFWNGKNWERDTILKRNEMIKQLYKYVISYIFEQKLDVDKQSELLKYYNKLADKNFRDKIIKDAMSIRPIKSSVFDSHKLLFNCQNGTYDFATGKFREHRKEDYLTDISNVVYDPNAKAPRFEQYLQEVMENDATKVDYLLKLAAYCLTGDTSRECFIVLYGDKTRNGKGTFVSTLTYLSGTYTQTIKSSSITKKQVNGGGTGATPDIAKLKHARIANVNEIEEGMQLDVALMKEITGGDTMTARFLYKEEFDFVPQFKPLINTNVLPRMSDDSIFKSDRIQLLCFDRHFELNERDINLKDKLKAETNGIFNVIAPYYKKLQEEGFILPESTRKTLEQYKLNSNNVMAFVKDNLFESKNSMEKASDLYKKYAEWCEQEGLTKQAQKNFKERMIRLGAIYCEKGYGKNDKGESGNSIWVKGFTFTEPKNTLTPYLIQDDELPF